MLKSELKRHKQPLAASLEQVFSSEELFCSHNFYSAPKRREGRVRELKVVSLEWNFNQREKA